LLRVGESNQSRKSARAEPARQRSRIRARKVERIGLPQSSKGFSPFEIMGRFYPIL
jgi:hypothetical protein